MCFSRVRPAAQYMAALMFFIVTFLTCQPSIYRGLYLPQENTSVHFNKCLVFFFSACNYYAILFPFSPYANRYGYHCCFIYIPNTAFPSSVAAQRRQKRYDWEKREKSAAASHQRNSLRRRFWHPRPDSNWRPTA